MTTTMQSVSEEKKADHWTGAARAWMEARGASGPRRLASILGIRQPYPKRILSMDSTPARMIEDEFGGCRTLTPDLIQPLLEHASEHGMLDITVEYVEYRRPDLSDAIRANLPDRADQPKQ